MMMETTNKQVNDRILEILLNDEEITWQSILTGLVKTENLNPWDIDITDLSNKFIDTIKKLKEMDFRISGKIVLAAAILLRVKSVYLVTNDIAGFDKLLENKDDEEDGDEVSVAPEKPSIYATLDKFGIVPRTPLPRKRKVSIYDLIDALQKAMNFKNQKITRVINDKNDDKLRKLLAHDIDITLIIQDIYAKILDVYGRFNNEIPFEHLLPAQDATKRDKVLTFLPLLHLETKRKVHIDQKQTFGDIKIRLIDENHPVADDSDSIYAKEVSLKKIKAPGAKKDIPIKTPKTKRKAIEKEKGCAIKAENKVVLNPSENELTG